MKKVIVYLILFLSFGLVACTGSEAAVDTSSAAVSDETNEAVAVNEVSNPNETDTVSESLRLTDDYSDALSIMTQLALGTIQLDETDLAVDETLAAEILPLWQAAQSLSNSETAASVEVDAVLNQIQDTMTSAQVKAIAAMALTADSMTELLESGAITLGRGFGQGQGDGGEGGFTPPAGFVPGQGGGPGGGGGGLGGPGGGGFGGPDGGGNLSEADIATRQAELAAGGGFDAIQDQALVGAVVRLLQTKTGESVENPRGGIADAVYTAVSDTIGISVEAIQTELAGGNTLVALIEANGGDVTAVREAIIANLNELPNAADLDVEQIADGWLSEP